MRSGVSAYIVLVFLTEYDASWRAGPAYLDKFKHSPPPVGLNCRACVLAECPNPAILKCPTIQEM